MSKPIGSVCNLECTYCYYLEKKELFDKGTNFKMTEETLELYVKQYIEQQEAPVIEFVWHGGEPTIRGLDFYKLAIQFQNKYSGLKQIKNSFQTNGTLINEDWCHFFKTNNFLVGISIDGPENIHDQFRIFKNGIPSFVQVMKCIDLFHKHNVEFNTMSVVHRKNSAYPLEIYNFLKQIGSGFIQFSPIVERINVSKPNNQKLVSPLDITTKFVSEWSVLPEDYGRFICTLFDEWVQHDVGKVYVQLFDVSLANWYGVASGLCIFSPTCGDAPVMEYNGNIYSCDHFVFDNYLLGNIYDKSLREMMLSNKQIKFGAAKRESLTQQCMNCEVRFACHGECPKNRFTISKDGEYGLNYLCSAYYRFFKHITPYMKFMVEELNNQRPPANIMTKIQEIKNLM